MNHSLQGFKESVATSIEIPNIDYETFTTMMRYIYVGSVEVEPEQAMPLLQAADQYLLEGLKRLCEATLAQVGSAGAYSTVLYACNGVVYKQDVPSRQPALVSRLSMGRLTLPWHEWCILLYCKACM